jgi:succinate dehydrogenase / fumarate reductase cytochrome b subunit
MSDFLKSTVGRKYLMGLSGLVWAGFVFGHMAGNMLIFVSKEAYNSYGHFLTSGNFIYFVEAVLVIMLIAHIISAVSLILQNRRARPQGYAVSSNSEKNASLASRSMAVQGSVILAFVLLHLITFKFGAHYETTVNGVVMRDLARLVHEVFQQPIYVAGYFISLVVLGFHLRHGVTSIFQSFGLTGAYQNQIAKRLGFVYAAVVAAGFISQPLYVYFFAS